ncbi:MAG: hypothetical protein HY748_13870 [Elusimicrobia bacterium]|nr:hypothetical protein [Elusimicrobiota bacterium]
MRGSAVQLLLDAFGTRLEAGEVVSGLAGQGLSSFSLLVLDDELVLRLGRGVPEDLEARAVTWLKGLFSPLMPCRVERLPAGRSKKPVREVVSARSAPVHVVSLAEVWRPDDLKTAFPGLVSRLGVPPRLGIAPAQGRFVTLPEWRQGLRWSASRPGNPGPVFLSWRRPGGPQGVRPAWLLAASLAPEALEWLAAALEGVLAEDAPFRVLLDGLEWGVARRPTVAAFAQAGFSSSVTADAARCRCCGLCSRICPAGRRSPAPRPCPGSPARGLAGTGEGRTADACLRCFDCVEACPVDALRPVYGASSALLSRRLSHRPQWLSRLAGHAGPATPAPFPPSYLLPKDKGGDRPRVVLGLAIATLQEHAAALVKDGRLVGAVEEERFSRVRHHGFRASGRPGVGIAADPTICVEEVFCRGAISALLGPEGLSLDDADLIAVNGLPARYRRAFSATDADRPIPALRAGRVVYVPHHLSHAASAFRTSGMDRACILTVDGRGDRETAAVFRAVRGEIEPVLEVLCLTDRSIGGVYETVARHLGFGPHGQGSVMALASFGRPKSDFRPFLSWRGPKDFDVHESGIVEGFAGLARKEGWPLGPGHRDLAASLQDALEKTIASLLRTAGLKPGAEGLCLAGGVALNCRMNRLLRRLFRPKRMFVQPGANDGGTALGAALEALHLSGRDADVVMEHALLGPAFGRADIEGVLMRSGLSYRLAKDAPEVAARRLADGQVVCWFDGRMEFGPRALGSRSILADPRRPELKDRVNVLKSRPVWRPFGPAILAGCEKDWFDEAFDSRFMLFTLPLKKDKARLVPAVLHVDGTTRPQVVHREHQPRFHALIRRFEALTGVPMVLNTSFNRRGEPIVCTPHDAVECFRAIGADCLVIGDFVVDPKGRRRRPEPGASRCSGRRPGRWCRRRASSSPAAA